MQNEIRKNSIQSQDKIVAALSQLLADTYVLYVQTQNFHWNITGPHFYAYHKMFEDQYEKLSKATDKIAERIRSLQGIAPGTMKEFLKLTSLSETTTHLTANNMMHELLKNHEKIIQNLLNLFEIAKENNDEVTLDLMIERKAEHEEIAWMLRSTSA